jgi:large subunit ribosomal protein L3
VARVTVLAAGPCHVTAIRTSERDGYNAVQLAFGSVREKALTKPELGHLAKADAPPLRHLVEFRDEGDGLHVGETVEVSVFEPGQHVKISGVSKGKGFQGTSSATASAAARPDTAPTTCARRVRSAPRRGPPA